MKLPLAFGNRLLFRLVLPGLILALALAPGVQAVLTIAANINLDPLSYLPFAAIFLGWLISLCDMPIYMFYEGRRFWPRSLAQRLTACERKRQLKLLRQIRKAKKHGDYRTAIESYVELSRFPLDPRGRWRAELPTRLGNLIREYEIYPLRKYGLDSVFYFYRIWVSIDKDLREEIDNRQAFVDGSLYVSFVLVLTALCMAIYGLVGLASSIKIPWLGAKWIAFALAGLSVVLAYIIYRLSLFAHAQFGDFYKSLFDQHRSKIEIKQTLDYLAHATGDQLIALSGPNEANMAVWRYLQWHMVRLTGAAANENFEAAARRRRKQTQPAAAGRPSRAFHGKQDSGLTEFDHLEAAELKTGLDRAIDRVGSWISYLFLIGVVISFYEVVMRYVFGAPTRWVHETTVMLVAVSFAYGGAYALARDSHIRIGLLYNWVSPRTRRYLDILNAALTLLFMVGIGYAALDLVEKSVLAPDGGLRLEGTGTGWNPPFPSLVKGVLLLCAALMAVQTVLHLVRAVRGEGDYGDRTGDRDRGPKR